RHQVGNGRAHWPRLPAGEMLADADALEGHRCLHHGDPHEPPLARALPFQKCGKDTLHDAQRGVHVEMSVPADTLTSAAGYAVDAGGAGKGLDVRVGRTDLDHRPRMAEA